MSKLKTALIAALALSGAATANAAFAQYHYEVWTGSGWSDEGTAHLRGPIVIGQAGGYMLPCDVDITLAVSGGNASVTAIAFANGASTCPGTVGEALPWPLAAPTAYTGGNPPFLGAPTLTGALWNMAITGVRIRVPGVNYVCPYPNGTGTVLGVLDNGAGAPGANRYVFSQMLGPCAFMTRKSAYVPNALLAEPQIRVAGAGHLPGP
ncbi:hypothetical protein [Luteimonas aquatica]|uniref:hypothetical protein n=1 Tax=Luteimonas aquatica TaxID=450364 RepID=UPI001F567EB8|nr:hypothetical protein [Luteimonas aquatica]